MADTPIERAVSAAANAMIAHGAPGGATLRSARRAVLAARPIIAADVIAEIVEALRRPARQNPLQTPFARGWDRAADFIEQDFDNGAA